MRKTIVEEVNGYTLQYMKAILPCCHDYFLQVLKPFAFVLKLTAYTRNWFNYFKLPFFEELYQYCELYKNILHLLSKINE